MNCGLIQFSGVKPLEGVYVPNSNGSTGVENLNHWEWGIKPIPLTEDAVNTFAKTFNEIDYLDGNGQLALCLQDCALSNVLNQDGIFDQGHK